jgi:hypothetical protein
VGSTWISARISGETLQQGTQFEHIFLGLVGGGCCGGVGCSFCGEQFRFCWTDDLPNQGNTAVYGALRDRAPGLPNKFVESPLQKRGVSGLTPCCLSHTNKSPKISCRICWGKTKKSQNLFLVRQVRPNVDSSAPNPEDPGDLVGLLVDRECDAQRYISAFDRPFHFRLPLVLAQDQGRPAQGLTLSRHVRPRKRNSWL